MKLAAKVWMLILIFVVGSLAEAPAAIASSVTTTAPAELKSEKGLFGKKRKRYKKPKEKRFLGIFKKRNSCSCPKY